LPGGDNLRAVGIYDHIRRDCFSTGGFQLTVDIDHADLAVVSHFKVRMAAQGCDLKAGRLGRLHHRKSLWYRDADTIDSDIDHTISPLPSL